MEGGGHRNQSQHSNARPAVHGVWRRGFGTLNQQEKVPGPDWASSCIIPFHCYRCDGFPLKSHGALSLDISAEHVSSTPHRMFL